METRKRIRSTVSEKLTELRSKGTPRKGLEEISLEIAETFGLTPKVARQLLDAFLDNITGALHEGRDVLLPGFGSFRVIHREARRVRNPRQWDAFVNRPASTAFRFKPGTGLKPIFR